MKRCQIVRAEDRNNHIYAELTMHLVSPALLFSPKGRKVSLTILTISLKTLKFHVALIGLNSIDVLHRNILK